MAFQVVFDIICPWCFVGWARLRRTQRERAASGLPNPRVRWRSFLLAAHLPGPGMEYEGYLRWKFGGADRARQIRSTVVDAGRDVGLRILPEAIGPAVNTSQAHALIHRAGGRADAVVDRLFHAMFVEGRRLSDPDTLAAIADEFDLDAAETRRRAEQAVPDPEVEGDRTWCRRVGVTGVPTFGVDARFMAPGAQEVAAFDRLFDLALQLERETTPYSPGENPV